MTPSLPLTGCASRRITGRRRTGGSCWRRLAAGLLRAATELLQAAGLPRICGETRLSNEAMRRTFAACGYRLTRIEEAYYDHPPENACKYERQFET